MSEFVTITLGDVAIALSAVIGVYGSYSLYKRRRIDTAEQLRHALFAEIGQMGDRIHREAIQMKGSELTKSPYRPEESPISTTVYDNNAGELGRLTENEIESITLFYTKAKLADRRIRRAITESETAAIKLIYIRGTLVELNNRKNDALDAISSNIEESPVEVEHRADLEGGGDPTLSEIRSRLHVDRDENDE